MPNVEDANLFMMCESPGTSGYTGMPEGYGIRPIRRDELGLWMAFPFDDPAVAREQRGYMEQFYQNTYADRENEFFEKCLFVVDEGDNPIATLFAWRVYEKVMTLHWFKTLPNYEGKGIGRALLSHVMNDIAPSDYPVFLHTQPASFRAIKLYTDFGFVLLRDPVIGSRENGLDVGLPYLKERMPKAAYDSLRFGDAPQWFLNAVDPSLPNRF